MRSGSSGTPNRRTVSDKKFVIVCGSQPRCRSQPAQRKTCSVWAGAFTDDRRLSPPHVAHGCVDRALEPHAQSRECNCSGHGPAALRAKPARRPSGFVAHGSALRNRRKSLRRMIVFFPNLRATSCPSLIAS